MYGGILAKLGLGDKEAKIYDASLHLGPETIQKIAHRAGIKRTAAYRHIRSLIRKGLMSSTTRDKKAFFSVEPPENLYMLLETRKKETKQISSDLRKSLPQLRVLFEANEERPRVRFFEGRAGLKSMYNDFLKSKPKPISVEEFVPVDEVYNFLPPQENDYSEKIEKKFKRIPWRVMYTSEKGAFLKSREGRKERHFLARDKFPFTGRIIIYGNKIACMSHKRTITGVIIENKEIANTLRMMFGLAWSASGQFKK